MAVDGKALAEIIAKLKVPMKDVPFETIIKELYGVSVVKFDATDGANKKAFDSIKSAMKQTCLDVRGKPIKRSRINEVGNDMEPFVITALTGAGFEADKPRTTLGKGKYHGYPDIRIEQPGGLPIYLEVKVYSQGRQNKTFRAFYFSPSHDPKVTEDAHHLLVGFEFENKGNQYWPVAYELTDLFGLECDLKAEFNSNNRRLYQDGRILARGQVPIKS